MTYVGTLHRLEKIVAAMPENGMSLQAILDDLH